MKQHHLARLEDLVKDPPEIKKKALNYVNYTKENYNILTLEKHSEYYDNFQRKIPVYIREQPDWTKSSYKRKNNKPNKYNYIIFRNIQNLKQPKNQPYSISRDSLYKLNKSINENPIRKKTTTESIRSRVRSVKKTLPPLSKSSVSYSNSKSHGGLSKVSGLSEVEQLIKRAEQLGKFVQSVKSEEEKEVAKMYGKELIGKMKASDITKERMKIALLASADELQKIFEENLGVKLDVEEAEKKAEEIEQTQESPKGSNSA